VLLPPDPHPALASCLRGFARQALHARRLEFAHPTDARTIALESPLPPDMVALLGACEQDLKGR
jgi:23S rRNA pseudouridine1911/1915/1917 synthase